MVYEFDRDPLSGLILVEIRFDKKYKFKMMFDTGASHSTFDLNALRMKYYQTGSIIETGMVETANGIVNVNIIHAESISAFGHEVCNINVQAYDFLAHGILSDYDGVLGLDFFENTKFCIDMTEQTIEVVQKRIEN